MTLYGDYEEVQVLLGQKIKKARKEQKLTQEKLAEQTDLSIEYISRLERGIAQPSLKTLLAIARALDVSMGCFFEGFQEDYLLKRNSSPATRKSKKKLKADYISHIEEKLKIMEMEEVRVLYEMIRVLTDRI